SRGGLGVFFFVSSGYNSCKGAARRDGGRRHVIPIRLSAFIYFRKSSSMALTAAALRELHRIHRQLTDLSERKDRGPKQIKAREANLGRLGEELARVQAEHKAARMRSDQKQLLLKSGEEKVEGLKAKLNAASSNREYQALKDQIAADQMAGSVLADEILEATAKIDEQWDQHVEQR